jgi:hypothetical protein
MTKPPRPQFFVRSADGQGIRGYADKAVADYVALEFGEGTVVVDTEATTYKPLAEEVSGGKLRYVGVGGWGARTLSDDQNLIEAIKRKQLAAAHAYLELGASPDATDKNGGPALHWAVASRQTAIVRLLLDHGAEHGRQDKTGKTARDIAKIRGNSDIVKILGDIAT